MNAVVLGLFLTAIVASVAAEPGYISVYNNGGYVATFYVEYKVNGQQKSESSGDFTLGVTKTVKIPEDATDVYTKVELYWFFGSKSAIFSQSFPGPTKQCYKVWGTTLSPNYAKIGC